MTEVGRPQPRGFTLVELSVALGLVGLLGLTFATSVVGARRMRQTGEDMLHATQIATQGMEWMRSGRKPPEPEVPAGFRRTCRLTGWRGSSTVRLAEVVVEWRRETEQRFVLSALLPRTP
jgi:prepilin-type N-terminal cleavage/methylation domain-containing protein